MALFSQRAGIRPVTKALQSESIDEELRNSLWSSFHDSFVRAYWFDSGTGGFSYYPHQSELDTWLYSLWTHFMNLPSDTKPKFRDAVPQLREQFFASEWHWVLDFLEFSAKHSDNIGPLLIKHANKQLERHNSIYRFVGCEITSITDPAEVAAIEEALDGPKAVRAHLTAALGMLSDRRKPDFRNSIKESVSAVEAICRLVSGSEKDTLAGALKVLTRKHPIHPAFEQALLKLYGFSSDEGGIRHSLLDEPHLSYADAKFMLVLCSGFVNFVLAKSAEEGVKLK